MSKRDESIQRFLRSSSSTVQNFIDQSEILKLDKPVKLTDKEKKELLKNISATFKSENIETCVTLLNSFIKSGMKLESVCNYLDKKTTDKEDRAVLEKILIKINPTMLTEIKNNATKLNQMFSQGKAISSRLAESSYSLEAFSARTRKLCGKSLDDANSCSERNMSALECMYENLMKLTNTFDFVNWLNVSQEIVERSMETISRLQIFKCLDAQKFTKGYIGADGMADAQKCAKLVRKQEFDILQFVTQGLAKLKEYEKTLNKYKLK